MNLPSREQMTGIAERLDSIESQLREIKSMLARMSEASGEPEAARAPRPARTRRQSAGGVDPK